MMASALPASHPWELESQNELTSQFADLLSSDSSSFSPAPKIEDSAKLGAFTTRLPFALHVVDTGAIPLPAAPSYVEPHSSFHSPSSAQELMTALEECLTACNIDYQINRTKYKFTCITYGSNGVCHFKVRLFKSAGAQQQQVLVEFQRRRGCCVDFKNVYNKCRNKISPNHSTEAPTNRCPLPFPALEEASGREIVESCQRLIQMAQAKQIDVQREAVCGLVSLSTQTGAATHIVSGTSTKLLVSTIVALLKSSEEDIARGACVVLHNLLGSGCKDLETEVLARSAEMVQVLCQSPLSLDNTDTKRFLSACISLLGQSLPLTVLAPFTGPLSELRHCSDERLRTNVTALLHALPVC
jgi:hypothetical protein